MAEPYRGPNLGPLQPNAPPPSADWSAYPEVASDKGAASGADWSAYPEVGPMETAKDVGKSLATGVARGAIALGGALGDLTDLGAKGIEKASNAISDAIGIDRYERPKKESVLNAIPTSKSLTENVEGVTGKFHEPETTAGHYAETVGEFLPAVVGGPAGIGRRVAMQAVVPGVASEAAGQLTKGTGYETAARIAGGLAGGGVGAVLSRPSSAQKIIRNQLPEGITQAHIDDAERMIAEAQQRGINLSWPEALSQAAGRPVLTDTMRMVESSPETRAGTQRFFGERPQQFDQAALDAVDQIAPGTAAPSSIGRGVSEAAEGHLNDVRQTINRAAEPYYQASENVLLSPQEMVLIHRAVPGFTEAAEAVRNGPNAWRIEHLPDNSVGFLNAVKKHFDTAAENAGSRFNPLRNHETQATHEMQASAVRQIGELASQDYQTALEIGRRGREQFLQPLMDGPLGKLAAKPETKKAIDVLFPSNPLPNSHNEIHDAVSVLARRNPWAATQLVRAYVERTFNEATRSLQSGANQFGPASFAKDLVGNAQQRENLRAAIEALPNGQHLWEGFDRFLEIAEATRYRQTIGSKTAFNEAERKALAASNLGREVAKVGASPGKWWTYVSDKVDRWSLGRNLDELARIFTDPQSAPLLRRIARMPSTSNEAAAVVARLIANAERTGMRPSEQSSSKPANPARP